MLEFPGEIPTYSVAYAGTPPATDGWLESPCWQHAHWVDRFITSESGEATAHPISAALLWDECYLYLGIKVSEPRLAYVHAEAVTSGELSADDTIELYLNPGVPEMEYLSIAVNPLGQSSLAVHLIDNPGWGTDHARESGGMRTAARLTGAGWQVELAMPFAELQLPAPVAGAAWRGNICRNDKLNYNWSFWSLRDDAFAGYNDVQLFPYLRFTGPQPCAMPTPISQPSWPATPRFAMRGIMYDTSRGSMIYPRAYWERKLPFLHELGLNTVLMYFENHLRYTRHHAFAPEGSWSLANLRGLQLAARVFDIDIVPCQTSLGHCSGILSHPQYRHLAEEGSDGYQFCPSHPETPLVLGEIFDELSAASLSPYVSINADESAYLGLCPRCHEKYAGWSKGDIFREHILRLYDIITAHGKRMMMWDDMLWTFPEALDGLPRDIILLDWHYTYHRRYPSVDVWRNMGFDVVVCPGMGLVENACWMADYGAARGAMGLINTLWEEHSLPLGNYWQHFLATSWAAHAPAPEHFDEWFALAGTRLFGAQGARLGHSLAAEYLVGRHGYGGQGASPALNDFAARQILQEAAQLLAGATVTGKAHVWLEEFFYARRLQGIQAEVGKLQEGKALTPEQQAELIELKAEGLARWHAQCPVASQRDAFLERFTAIEKALKGEKEA